MEVRTFSAGSVPEFPELAGMIRVHPTEDLYYWLDAVSGRAVCGIPEAD